MAYVVMAYIHGIHVMDGMYGSTNGASLSGTAYIVMAYVVMAYIYDIHSYGLYFV